jgi:hypothetical protein
MLPTNYRVIKWFWLENKAQAGGLLAEVAFGATAFFGSGEPKFDIFEAAGSGP